MCSNGRVGERLCIAWDDSPLNILCSVAGTWFLCQKYWFTISTTVRVSVPVVTFTQCTFMNLSTNNNTTGIWWFNYILRIRRSTNYCWLIFRFSNVKLSNVSEFKYVVVRWIYSVRITLSGSCDPPPFLTSHNTENVSMWAIITYSRHTVLPYASITSPFSVVVASSLYYYIIIFILLKLYYI